MKILKGIPIFLIFSVLLGSCVDQPQFSNTPTIEIAKIEFVDLPGVSDFDSLNIYLEFKDGDGDLGIGGMELNAPFNSLNFFLGDGNGATAKIPTTLHFTDLPPFVDPGTNNGKLITIRTRQEPGYEFLPPYSCEYYTLAPTYILEQDLNIVDDTYHFTDTLFGTNTNAYILGDTLYYERNPYHNNIEVDWLVKNPDNSFTEFDWYTEFDCGTTFDGRYPVLNNSDKSRPLEGTLKYGMTSSGFVPLFSLKVLKLRILFRDRALNEYEAETTEFTLNEIKKN